MIRECFPGAIAISDPTLQVRREHVSSSRSDRTNGLTVSLEDVRVPLE